MNILTTWRIWLLKSIHMQLFLSLISLPFLIGWGLPLSLLSPIATLLFTPFLSIFLLLSSIVFFLELAHIPNGWVITLLEYSTSLWMWLLAHSSNSWLIGFAKPHWTILITLVAVILATLHYKKFTSLYQCTSALALLFALLCIALSFFPYKRTAVYTIKSRSKEITLILADSILTIVDPGGLSSQQSYESWISFTLIPEIIQKTGRTTIDHMIIQHINQRTFEALTYLAAKMPIKKLYLPWWTEKIPSFAWKSYVKCKKMVALTQGNICSISRKHMILNTEKTILFIEPNQEKKIHYYGATYPLLNVHARLDDTTSITL